MRHPDCKNNRDDGHQTPSEIKPVVSSNELEYMKCVKLTDLNTRVHFGDLIDNRIVKAMSIIE